MPVQGCVVARQLRGHWLFQVSGCDAWSGVEAASLFPWIPYLGFGMAFGRQSPVLRALWCVGRRCHWQGALGQTWIAPFTLVNFSFLETGPDAPKLSPLWLLGRDHLSYDLQRLQWRESLPVGLGGSSSYSLSLTIGDFPLIAPATPLPLSTTCVVST